ncbi:MAG TPA: ATP-binding protein [Bacilli bacterium]|nr:ATP-binding protein [Bacilli bacterium]
MRRGMGAARFYLLSIGLYLVVVSGGGWLAYEWGRSSAALRGPGSGSSSELWMMLFGAFALLGLIGAYLLIAWQKRRWQGLVAQTEEVLFAPFLQEVQVRGDDEVADLARYVNRLREELTRGEEARNQLVADVAHELRTPLAILRGQLESMQEGAAALTAENLLPLLDETARMGKLVQDLQQLSLAKAGRLPLQREWVVLRDLLDEVLAVLEPEALGKGVWLLASCQVREEMYVDRSRIKQVLINLIGNAIRYTQAGDTVEVRAEGVTGGVAVEVVDDGPGIPPESLPYLFERFYRVEGSRNRKSGGMGIGLALAKEYVEAHEGTISVQSELGEGTTFRVTWPLFPES